MKPDFKKYTDGLVPVIVQDDKTNLVLMMGYMNEEAFSKTVAESRVVFFSRSKQRLWMKGETSGNYLTVQNILLDCDEDCILIKADPQGPVCHTDADTCFNEKNKNADFLYQLEQIISDRKQNPIEASYTGSLFKKGINAIAQKVGEEAVELIIEAKDYDMDKFTNEAADLLYHYLILLQAKDIYVKDVVEVLQNRHTEKEK